MNDNDKKQFAEIMYGLAEAYPNASISKSWLRLYFEALGAYTVEDIKQAAISLLQTRTYPTMPTIAEIIQHTPGQKQITAQSKAQIEADKIISHLNMYGSTRLPEFTDPITEHLMTGHWPYQNWASKVLESELKWWTKEFCEAYQSYDEAGHVLQIEAPEKVLKLTDNIGNLNKETL